MATVYYVYLLECAGGSLYCGYTTNLERRMALHRAGKGAKYTRSHPPLRLAYWEACPTRGEALRRERAVKRLSRQEKLALAGLSPQTPKSGRPEGLPCRN